MTSPRQQEESSEQGELLHVAISRTAPAEIIGVYPEGSFAEVTVQPEALTLEGTTQAVAAERLKTQHRREGQAGKHSPLSRGESYLEGLRPGDFLPDFGPVKDSNWEAAKLRAAQLDSARRINERTNPPIFPRELVAEVEPIRDPSDKLIILRDDERAGFLPTTNQEKNQAVKLLEFVHNPRYPEGINEYLNMIFMRQQKIAQNNGLKGEEIKTSGMNAVMSVVNEWADYLQNARHSQMELRKLQFMARTANQSSSLRAATKPRDGQTYDIAALVRYVDLIDFREHPAHFSSDPLRTKTDRQTDDMAKHKTVGDKYTLLAPDEETAAHILAVSMQTTVHKARPIIIDAIKDQALRELFWQKVFQSVNKQDGFSQLAADTLNRIYEPVPNHSMAV